MLTKATDIAKMREAFYASFCSRNPFEPSGNLDMPHRIILYPTYGYHLAENQFQAVVEASLACGEESFLISEVEYQPDPFVTGQHWVCKGLTFDEYLNLPLSVENALYSLNGEWGILVSHEDHALLVSRFSFWEHFQRKYPQWKDDHEKFIEFWRQNVREYGSDVGWLKIFLAHLSA
ncbi:MAG: hypothetical protein HYR56_14730 [Acidobacteria bacterium]|nr:hypothetical protein [Acidobacteriota bacterium]MBI3425797.1 hypothetical protein [Acidobacteriota bacterium]